MENKIQPRLKTFDLTMIVMGLVIGMGIFRTPPEVAQKAGTSSIFFIAWITGAVVSMIGALTFAEIGSRYPAAGGFYKIFSHCYHPSFAFMVNWITVISNAASTAGVAIMGAEYIAPILFPTLNPETAARIITTTSVIFLYIINMLGIKVSSKVLNVLMIIKISMLLLLISALFFVVGPHANDAIKTAPQTTEDMLKCFALCFIPVFFTYGGYQQTMNFGSDVKNPSRTMPRAIFYGMTVVLCIYLLANLSYVKVLGFAELQKTKTLASDISQLMFGAVVAKLVALIMFFCVMAYVNVSMLSNPRIYFAMAEDGVFPKIFSRVNARTQVQEWAVSLFTVFILLTLFFMSSFQTILQYVMFFDSISLISAAACIFILRYRAKKNKHEIENIFKMKAYPYLPIFYILIYMVVNASVLLSKPEASLWGFVLFVSGLPLFYLMRFLIRKTTRKPIL
ncbi:MAG: amino acid permease [Bacteroidia bacterium]|nr:amino acid permease [Bacteroidia bacterium]